jgi:hypothetical protein
MVNVPYNQQLTALLVIDPYNDFISEGGKVWDRLKAVAEANRCVPHMLEVLHAARQAEEAGPFMCAGVTVYNALRHAGARAGEVVAVHGIGGLGHLGVQYARQMGFETVAINRGNDKEPLARQLSAHHLHRCERARCGDGVAKAGRRPCDSGDRAERAGDFCPDRRLVAERHPVGAGCAGGAVDDQCDVAHQWQAIGGRVVFRHREGFARHPGIQCLDWCAPDA